MRIDFLSRTYFIPWRFVYAPFFHASFSDLVLHFLRFRVFFFLVFPVPLRFLSHVRSTTLLIHCFLRLNFCAVCLSSFLCIPETVLFVPSRLPCVCVCVCVFPYQHFTYPHLHPFFQIGSKILMPNSMLFLLLSSLSWNSDDLLFAGIGDQCKNEGIMKFTEVLSEMSGAEGHCMYLGSTLTSCLIPKSAI
jgi:hypothetical protein